MQSIANKARCSLTSMMVAAFWRGAEMLMASPFNVGHSKTSIYRIFALYSYLFTHFLNDLTKHLKLSIKLRKVRIYHNSYYNTTFVTI